MESLAGIFSAKEAFFKAADGLEHLPRYRYSDVEIRHSASGRPQLLTHGALGDHFRQSSLRVDLSISHSSGMAGAVVLIGPDPDWETSDHAGA